MADLPLNVGKDLPSIGPVPAPVEVFFGTVGVRDRGGSGEI
jgi:hypothetical protein